MTNPIRRTIPALAAGALGMGAAVAFGAEPATTSAQDLQTQIQQLQAQVQQLQASQAAQGQTLNARDVDATVASVLRDADRHSQFMEADENFVAGYKAGTGFTLQTASGDFLLHPYLQFQVRDVTTYRDDQKQGGKSADIQNGFEIRRMKLGFDGNLFSKDLTFNILWTTDRKTGAFSLEESYVRYKFAPDWAVKTGQYKDPFAHEGITSSKKLLAAERSYLIDTMAGADNYIQGISLIWDNGGNIRAEGAFTDGFASNNQNFQDFPTNRADWGAAGRVEYKAYGNWKDYEDFRANAKENLLVIGAAGDYTEAGDTDAFLHTIDAQWKGGQWSVFGAYIGRYTKNPVSRGDSQYDWGAEGQVAYALDQHWEPFARYDYTNTRTSPVGNRNHVHEITVGTNYYFHGHAAKLTLDGSYLPNGAPAGDDASGVLATNGKKAEFVIRAQFQLLI